MKLPNKAYEVEISGSYISYFPRRNLGDLERLRLLEWLVEVISVMVSEAKEKGREVREAIKNALEIR